MKRTLFARVLRLSLLIAAVAIWIASYHRDISAHRITDVAATHSAWKMAG